MKSDQKLKEMFKVFVDEDGVINLDFLIEERGDEENTRIAEIVKEEVLEIFKKNPKKKYNFLVDLLPLGQGGYFTSKARKIYIELGSHYQVKKVAVLGGSIYTKTAVIFILSVSGRGGTTRWFKSKKEAMAWMKKKD